MQSNDRWERPDECAAAAQTGAAVALGSAVSPRTVIRGESPQTADKTADALVKVHVLTDWLNVTFPFSRTESAIEGFVRRLTETTDGVLGGMEDRGRGQYGWMRSFAFDRGQVLFAIGGQRETAFLSLPGEGCALVPNWLRLVQLLRDELRGRITRWDGAVDDFLGVHSVDVAVQLYLSGGFNSGGRPPRPRQAGNWLTPDNKGRTFYVGERSNGKLLRVYEKGKQFGLSDCPWVRWEVEFHNADRTIPWEVLLDPERFIAGAYPCMAWIGAERTRIATVRRQDSLTYGRMTDVASIAYGRLINLMVEREGSAERVVDMLRRSGVPRRLEFSDRFLRRHGEDPGV